MDPALEPCSSQLASKGLTVCSQIYWTERCMVYRAYDARIGAEVALKLIRYDDNMDWKKAMNEVTIQAAFDHPNVVKLYSYFTYLVSVNSWVLALELELLTCDVLADIQARDKSQRHYTDEELASFLFTVTHALAEAQQRGIAHRDIKPANIFVSQGVYKLGDFGSALQTASVSDMRTLVGTPFFLSPILRQALYAHVNVAYHNPFKSDMYSLGLTLLFMAQLELIPGLMDITESVGLLQRSDWLKGVIGWMLRYDESERPDFVTLFNYLYSQQVQGDYYPKAVDVKEAVTIQAALQQDSSVSQVEEARSPISTAPIAPASAPAANSPSTQILSQVCKRCGKQSRSAEMIEMKEEDMNGWFHYDCVDRAKSTDERKTKLTEILSETLYLLLTYASSS